LIVAARRATFRLWQDRYHLPAAGEDFCPRITQKDRE